MYRTIRPMDEEDIEDMRERARQYAWDTAHREMWTVPAYDEWCVLRPTGSRGAGTAWLRADGVYELWPTYGFDRLHIQMRLECRVMYATREYTYKLATLVEVLTQWTSDPLV